MKIKSIILTLCLLSPLTGYCAQTVVDVTAAANASQSQSLQTEQLKELKEIHSAIETNNMLLRQLINTEIENGVKQKSK